MLRLDHFEDRRRRGWCAVVILAAVFSLTVSVATRYSSAWRASSSRVNIAQKHTSPSPSRQRLTKTAADWMPPVVAAAVLEAPAAYPRIAPAGPPIPNLRFDESLWNRPPPIV